jgi:hypothetical protein
VNDEDSVIPGLTAHPWYVQKAARALLSGVATVVSLGVAVYAAFVKGDIFIAACVAFSSVFSGAHAAVGFLADRYDDRRKKAESSPLDLRGCLHVIYAVALSAKSMPTNDPRLRVTLHRIEGENVVQLFPYVGGEGGGQGRKFSARSGVVGKAVTAQRPWAMHRANDSFDEYIKQAQEDYGMTEKEAKSLARGRMSFLAVPIGGGVVYLDCSDRDFFDSSTVGIIVDACAGLSQFVNFRYAKEGKDG